MSIHATDPFATPEEARSPVRRLRGRLPAAVTVWTAYATPSGRPAGLTVASTVVADGDPGRLLGLVDEESELYAAVRTSGRFAMTVLHAADRRLADNLAGILPVPGGPFQDGWERTEFGPIPYGAPTWAGCRVEAADPFGWSLLLMATIEVVHLGKDDPALIHYRGRYADGPA
jgi:flavin reductase (DIM6/NTAB) family NADH-FMN oxidoreductase RutF